MKSPVLTPPPLAVLPPAEPPLREPTAAEDVPPTYRSETPLPKWLRWLDADYFPDGMEAALAKPKFIEHARLIPFLFIHLGCLFVLGVGWSWTAVAVAAALYVFRIFTITAFYHRYFAHRTYQTGRVAQFLFALAGLTAMQRGPLWWAAHHRHHHRHSDQPDDIHSPRQAGFQWAHMGWILTTPHMPTRYDNIRDFAKFPELVFLNRFDWLGSVLLIGGLLLAGSLLHRFAPHLGTDAWQLVVWGFFISTTLVLHGTFTINSLAHVWGTRRFETTDDSRNNGLLALITLGEGWHNNHHRYPGAARQGFYWWEFDPTYIVLKGMAAIGLIRQLHAVPQSVYDEVQRRSGR